MGKMLIRIQLTIVAVISIDLLVDRPVSQPINCVNGKIAFGLCLCWVPQVALGICLEVELITNYTLKKKIEAQQLQII